MIPAARKLRTRSTVAREVGGRRTARRGGGHVSGAVVVARGASPAASASALTTESARRPHDFRPAAGRGSLPGSDGSSAVLDVTSTTNADTAQVELDRPLLTAEEVAALLAVPRSSVYEYARRRVDPLPSLLIGRHRRFDRRTVERWLAEHLNVTR